MKASDLKAGKTYVGKGGKRRYLIRFLGRDVSYDVPDGGRKWCGASRFARWAEREATPEESAP